MSETSRVASPQLSRNLPGIDSRRPSQSPILWFFFWVFLMAFCNWVTLYSAKWIFSVIRVKSRCGYFSRVSERVYLGIYRPLGKLEEESMSVDWGCGHWAAGLLWRLNVIVCITWCPIKQRLLYHGGGRMFKNVPLAWVMGRGGRALDATGFSLEQKGGWPPSKAVRQGQGGRQAVAHWRT